MSQKIGPRELALRAQREQRYQTRKGPRKAAGAPAGKPKAIPPVKPNNAHKTPR